MFFQGPIQPATLPSFTPRERDMIPLLAIPRKVAARRLSCSESNVKAISTNICQKLGVVDRQSALVRLAAAGVAIEVMETRNT
ncbi:LuxR C-terminal-related transcriptional regulator [Thioclava sp. DLFJ4-1]|uniref:LuxR C-terminal-related transcriptional regulator n=1 Tax=Thioclava sp. DLFJ4-1 TaxID=1915313 RepID=UPI0009C9F9F2|nr:LuxR C-terminal-related transcriptional regulator [Thioclava sp. DLFJ4-1]OOY16744.1 hypothetical protein BMI85_06685 [Thioclava sp. DLFJ4-1]